jgi:SAM-dependent methyltransferase
VVTSEPRCRNCGAPLARPFVDLGLQPPANRFLTQAELAAPEPLFPLKVYVCGRCLLVQLPEANRAADVFTAGYAYFSSYTPSWVEHAKRYVDMIERRLGLDGRSFVVEVASNDGYLLQHVAAKGIPCLGVDPAAGVAEAAAAKGVETRIGFFGRALAGEIAARRRRADLVVGNNVLAHVPDLDDFVEGLASLVKPEGWVTLEFPHLLRLIDGLQFDTIYDEHYSYFSLHAAADALARRGLRVVDVEELATHGGSLRVYARPGDAARPAPAVARVLAAERARGLADPDGYAGFQDKVRAVRRDFLKFLAEEKRKGRAVAAFGAAAKGNTFLNYCGVGADAIRFVADETPAKQGRFLPKSHIPVVAEAAIRERRPDAVVILPWNVKDEIAGKLAYVRAWGCRFATAIPEVRVW